MFELLLYVFIAVVIIQFLYHVFLFSRLAFYKPQKLSVKDEPVSVILYTKNQADKLGTTIDTLLNQQYHTFEIVVINNASTDETSEILKTYAEHFPNINIVDVKNNETFWGSTKYALTLGIKASKYNHLVFTDTLQTLVSPYWLTNMAARFTGKKSLVMGVELIKKERGFFNKIVRFRHISNQQWNISLTKSGKPIGIPLNNVGYTKNIFFENQGYIRFMNYFQYTHELFFSETTNRTNTAVCLAKEGFSYIEPPENRAEFIRQSAEERIIHKEFGWGCGFLKGMYSISVWLFFILLVILLINQHEIYIVLALLIFRYAFCWLINGKTYRYFGYKDLVWGYPFFEWIDLLTQLRMSAASILHKPLIKK
ncbi:glycosyltransferase [Avrilella dinanensis]|uniref:glycosyltransferase n=1 Tax=Avrilella dinanensis TaxID=2008672 RepID=UPI0024091C14|nr:glycosyltransferase [Avrilella dinanensis]